MQARRLPISTMIFLIALALLISSAFVGLVAGNRMLLVLLLWIIFIVLLLLLRLLYLIRKSQFSYFLLHVFRGTGWTCRWLNGGWRSHIVMLADAAIIYVIAKHVEALLLGKSPIISLLIDESIKSGTLPFGTFYIWSMFKELLYSISITIWFNWEKILVIWFLFEVAGILSKASNQLVIDEADLSAGPKQESKKGAGSDKDGKLETNGMADLLAVNINRIGELYRAVDERRAIKSASGAGRPIEATLKSVDMSEFLKNSASEKSQISFGPINIPIGSVTGLVGRLMQGPRISVALHKSTDAKHKEYYYLTATMSGKEPYSWIVEDQKPLEGDQETRSIDDMVTELSHRIFAKMIFGEQGKLVAWRAVWNFNEGLRAYRDCLLSVKKRQYFLKDAEKHFIETVEEDNGFEQAYYNLGVIYTELNQLESAESAFSKAIEKKPDKWEPYYALGINLYNRAKYQEELAQAYIKELPEPCKLVINRQYEMVIELCKHIINLVNKKGGLWNRDFAALAKAYDLMGNASCHLSMIECKHCRLISRDDNKNNKNSGIPQEHNLNKTIFDKAIESCQRAVHYSWLNLYQAEFWGDQIESANKIVSECLIDLAELYLYKEKYKIESSSDNYASKATKALEIAHRLQSADPNLYFCLGRAYFWLERFEAAKSVFEFGMQMSPEDSRFSAYRGYAQLKSKDGIKDILESWEKVKFYGPGASSEALDILEEACKNLKWIDSYQCMRANYASFLAKMNEDEDKGEAIIHCLKEMIKCGAKGENGEEWKYATASIRLVDLCNDLEAWDRKQVEKKKLFENHIYTFMIKLRALKFNKRGYEDAYSRYALGHLLFLYYNFKKDLYEDTGKETNAEKDEFEKKYLAYRNEAEENLANAKAILLDELEPKRSPQVYNECPIEYTLIQRYNANACLQDYSQFSVDSGQLYLKNKESEKAEEQFQLAIESLKEHPEEIKRLGLYSLLAKSLRVQNKSPSRALKLAQRARILNPLGYEERKELGKVFCELDEFDYGLEELDNAHSWKPDNPEILFEMGKYYLKRALICNDRNLRKKTLNYAMDNIKQALKILEKSQVEKRGLVRYWLGKVYSELNENKKAIPHFRILFNVRFDKRKSDDVWLIAAMQLGNAYLKIKSYNESYELFDQIIKSFGICDKNVTDDVVGKKLEDHFSKREIFINACLGKSYSCIDRSGDLNEALSYANLAGKYINLIKPSDWDNMNENDKKSHEERVRRCQASYEDCTGWIHYNLKNVNEAIFYLKMSVSRWAYSLTYIHLAFAYESKMESLDSSAEDKTFLARMALECCQLAHDFDMRDEYKEVLDNMKQKLSGKKIETSAKEGNGDELTESIGTKERCGQD